MKRKLTKHLFNTLLLTIVLLTSASAYADSEVVEIDQATYKVIKTDKSTRDDLYKGHAYAAYLLDWKGTDPIAIIPDEVRYKGKKYAVIEIQQAFWGNKDVEEIHFGKNVYKVTEVSFGKCPKLKRIYLSAQMSKIPTVENCPEFQGIIVHKDTEPLVSCGNLNYVKASSVAIHGVGDYGVTFSNNCNIDTLYVNYASSMLNVVKRGTGKVGTVVVKQFSPYITKPSVIYCNFDNLVIESTVTELPPNFIVNKDLKTLTDHSSRYRKINDGCFVGLPDDVQVNTTDDRIRAQVYYAQGLQKIETIANTNTDQLQKSSDLGCASATFELAKLSSDASKTVALLEKAKKQGCKAKELNEYIEFYNNCKKLDDLYKDVKARVQADKVDSTGYQLYATLYSKVVNPIDGTALRYVTSSYNHLANTPYYMIYYFSLCKAIQYTFAESYFYRNGLLDLMGIGSLYVNNNTINKDVGVMAAGVTACREVQGSSFDDTYKQFFSSRRQLVEQKRDQLDQRLEKDMKSYEEMLERKRREAQRAREERERKQRVDEAIRENYRKADSKIGAEHENLYRILHEGFSQDEINQTLRDIVKGK